MKTFYLPDLGEGLAEAEIREWYVKVGDVVTVDQPLVSMETAKAVVDVPSPYKGKIVNLHGNANEIIKTGAPLVSYEGQEGAAPEKTKSADKGSVVGKLETSESSWSEDKTIIGAAKTKTNNVKAMPAARVLATQLNVDLSQVKPTGPQGLITPKDVKEFIDKQTSKTSIQGGEELHGVRRFMAQAMTQSHQEIVPVTIIDDADLSSLPAKFDFTAHLLRAMLAGIKAEPALNAWFDGKTLTRKIFNEAHIGLALDTTEGLFVPVLRNVESATSESLRQQIDNYKEGARKRTIAQSDMQGATITLSNFGTISGRYATPIIIPPMVAILGCGRSRDAALVKDGKIVPGKVVSLSLTFDHRAVTGGEATRFLAAVIDHLQIPPKQ